MGLKGIKKDEELKKEGVTH